jgi:PhzF family phenazine biosynthesis protein
MIIPYFIADAFTAKPFHGNPAAVCILDSWPDDKLLQGIAFENNLSETAFLVRKEDCYELRWFTPGIEVDLCGHATLASAFVLFSYYERDAAKLRFKSMSGSLEVVRESGRLYLDFPSRPPKRCNMPVNLAEALGLVPDEVYISRDLLAVFKTEREIAELRPDFHKLLLVKEGMGVIVTAPGAGCDFVSRFFAPKAGVDEDPVTGSSHTTLIPFWSQRLHKAGLFARQISRRGGELWCEDAGARVLIGGDAVMYASGEIRID